MGDGKWVIKVTSKGQVTLPKSARNHMMVREGDQLDATLRGESLILTRRATPADSEQIRDAAKRLLTDLGYRDGSGGRKIPERLVLRDRIGSSQPGLTRIVREGREQR